MLRPRTAILTVLLLTLGLCPAWPWPALAGEGLTRVAEGVWTYAGRQDASPANSFAANAGVVAGTEAALAVDTLISAKQAKKLLDEIRRATSKRVRYAVDTHYHWDHAWGNSVFRDRGALIIGQEQDARALAWAGEPMLRKTLQQAPASKDLAGTRICPPGLTFTGNMTVDLGGVSARLIHVAPSHTPGSILVYVPERKVLFTGDILFTDFHPYLAEADLGGWVRNLDYILTLDADTIIPGHGPLSTKKDVAELKEYLLTFDRLAKDAAARGLGPDEAAAGILKALPARSQGGFLVKTNLEKKYLKKAE